MRIVISPGEPAGIGPDIILKLAQSPQAAELIVVGDEKLFYERASLLKIPIELEFFKAEKNCEPHVSSKLKIIPVPLNAEVTPEILNVKNADYVLTCLKIATDYCLDKKVDALVTGPINKEIINEANFAFTGHTELLQKYCNAEQSVMLFVVGDLKVALLTTHIPVANISLNITQSRLRSTIKLLAFELENKFAIKNPTILVCGLNPHAGEGGHLGREEIDVINPVLKELNNEGMKLVGPLPADTVFIKENLNKADAILGMYHDQVLPVVKHLGFDSAVNVTLGLPIIRTSVDHGTALSLAGTGKASSSSLSSAINLAISLAQNKSA